MADSPRDMNNEQQPPRKRGRRRAPVHVLTEADQIRVDSEVQYTTRNSRAPKTLIVYESYMNFLHEWYQKNHPLLCTPDGKVIFSKVRELCSTEQGLIGQAVIFKRCLMSKKHPTDLLVDGSPAPARSGSLSGYRSAWAYYVWSHNVPANERPVIPPEWDQSMQDFLRDSKTWKRSEGKKVCFQARKANPR